MPIEPANPMNSDGSGLGNLVSPRCATKIRFGDSANTPELPPKANPGSANGLCQPRTMSYGLGPTGPEITAVLPCPCPNKIEMLESSTARIATAPAALAFIMETYLKR